MNHLLPSDILAFINMPGGTEWIVILVIGLLLFGRRLPEVGRSLGRGIVEFKKGIKGIEDEIDEASNEPKARVEADRRESLPGAHSAPGTEARRSAPEVSAHEVSAPKVSTESNPYREPVDAESSRMDEGERRPA